MKIKVRVGVKLWVKFWIVLRLGNRYFLTQDRFCFDENLILALQCLHCVIFPIRNKKNLAKSSGSIGCSNSVVTN